MSDLKNNIEAVLALAPAVYTATKADADIIDLQGAGSATVIVNTGAIAGSGDFTISLRHGHASSLAGFITEIGSGGGIDMADAGHMLTVNRPGIVSIP